MKKTTTLFLVTSLPGILAGAVILLAVIPSDTANAQLDKSPRLLRGEDLRLYAENAFRVPFVSFANSHLNSHSILQNSEKDIVFIENIGQIRD